MAIKIARRKELGHPPSQSDRNGGGPGPRRANVYRYLLCFKAISCNHKGMLKKIVPMKRLVNGVFRYFI